MILINVLRWIAIYSRRMWHTLTRVIYLLTLFTGGILFTGCALLTSRAAWAEFDPAVLSQSTVRVLVKTPQGVAATATGFLWQSNDQVVTSLHVMSDDPKARIIVEFGKIKRRATIKAVLPNADLVLLTVTKPVSGWQPLVSFNGNKPKYKSTISALGFNRGARGLSTREFLKGYVNPEQLYVLLPPAALKQLSQSKVLDVKLPIYYLDGSLLPGYSGAPIVNAKGELVGIGDGGLEDGAASVSWVIPATNLTALMQSNLNTLPASLPAIRALFSGDNLLAGIGNDHSLPQNVRRAGLTGDISSGTLAAWLNDHVIAPLKTTLTATQSKPLPLANLSAANPGPSAGGNPAGFVEVPYRQFNFVKVKRRTYRQMVASSGNPADISKVFDLHKQFFHGYRLDHQQFAFDIYQDSRFGLNIAIPEDTELVVDDNNYLLAQGKMFCRRCNYEIQYHARTLDPEAQQAVHAKPNAFLNQVADQHWQDLNQEGDFGEYSDFRDIEAFGDHRYVLRAAYADFEEPFKAQYELNYFTAATNRDAWFQAQGILNRFDADFFSAVDKYRGTDCRQVSSDASRTALCEDIATMLKVLISVHLTAFSNKFYPPTEASSPATAQAD